MAQNKKQEKKKLASCIIGQAQVVFGGAVQVKMGSVQGNEDAVSVGLSELKRPCPQAGTTPLWRAPGPRTWCGAAAPPPAGC